MMDGGRRSGRRFDWLVGWVAGCVLVLLGTTASAQQQSAIWVSPDLTAELVGALASDGQLVEDRNGVATTITIAELPPGVGIDAHHRRADGEDWFSVDAPVQIGGLHVDPADVVATDGETYWLRFNASLEQDPEVGPLSRGVNVDAVAEDALGRLLLSFDTDQQFGGLVARDEDVVAYDGGLFTSWLDTSDTGIPATLDLDGFDYQSDMDLLFASFDGSGALEDLFFDDEDVLVYDPTARSWSMMWVGADFDPAWGVADAETVQVVPEPGMLGALAAGVGLLATAGRRRRPRRRAAVTATLMALGALGLAGQAGAVDGATQIGQSSALAGGVTPGDGSGFPVTLSQPGAYVLTSNLVVPGDVTAIEIEADDVHIDLNGFTVIGPATCTGRGPTITCTSSPTAHGIAPGPTGSTGVARTSSVRNGGVRGFNIGVNLGNGSRVAGTTLAENRLGLICSSACIVEENVVSRNATTGIATAFAGRIADNLVIGNGVEGILAGNETVIGSNLISDNANNGIYSIGRSVIRGNLIFSNDGDGIEGAGSALVSQNVAVANAGNGFRLGSGAGYIENVLAGNGVSITGGTGMIHNRCNGNACP